MCSQVHKYLDSDSDSEDVHLRRNHIIRYTPLQHFDRMKAAEEGGQLFFDSLTQLGACCDT